MSNPVARTVVALDVGSSGLRGAQFSSRGRRCRLDRYAAVPLPVAAVASGVVADPAAVAEGLRELWSAGRFSCKRVVFGVGNDRVLVRQLELDWMEANDFRRALVYSVANQIPMPVNEANLDYHVLEEIPACVESGTERTLRVLLVAAGREMVDGFTTALTQAGLRPVKAELAPFALIRAAYPQGPAIPTDPTVAEAILDLGAETLTVVVHSAGQPRFVRTVGKLGGRLITEALQHKFGWSYEQAEAAKLRYGLPRQRQPGGDPVEVERLAQQAVTERAGALVAEVRASLNFFLSAGTGITRLSRVALTGGGARLVGLPELIDDALQLDVVTLTPPADIRLNGHGLGPTTGAGPPDTGALPLLAGLALGEL